VRHRNGRYVWLRDHGFIEWGNDRPRRMIGSAVNVHEQKLFTQELERLVNERTKSLSDSKTSLERLNAELASFAYVASHDLREPIRKIMSFGDFLTKREKEKLSERGADYLKRMYAAAQRMDSMLDDLLTFSHVNTWDTKREPVDLNAVLSQAKSGLNGLVEETDATFACDALPTYNGVPFQLRQLFINLLENAIKFYKVGTAPHVVVTCNVVNGSVNTRLDASRDYLHIAVQDNGIGFESEYKERIFELFQRLHSKDKYKGTGIGLSICRKVAENHQGIITVDSRLGEGSTFHVYLPKD